MRHRPSRVRAHPPAKKHFRPHFEGLEDRNCPSAFTANPDTYQVQPGLPLYANQGQGGRYGVLLNDTLAPGVPAGVTSFTQPAHGYFSLYANGYFFYYPAAGFVGTDTFQYTLSDGTNSSTATVTLHVGDAPPPTDPTAVDDAFGLLQEGVIDSLTDSVLDNDTGGAASLAAVLASATAHGALTFRSDGTFTYEPDQGFVGTDSFTYRAYDGAAYSDPATVTLTVGLATAATGVVPAAEGTTFADPVGRFQTADPDRPETDFVASIDWGDGNTSFGDITPLGGGRFQVTFPYAYEQDGTYTARVTVTDNEGNSVVTETTVSVLNAAPQAVAVAAPPPAAEGDVLTLAGTYTDPGAMDAHTFRWEVRDASGTLVAEGTDEQLQFAPGDDGDYAATFFVYDDAGAMGSGSVTFHVANAPPVLLVNSAGPVDEGSESTVSLSSYDYGADAVRYWVINWGDGSDPETVPGGDIAPGHTYAAPGTYTVTATATDEDGSYQAHPVQVTVNNVAPAVTFTVRDAGGGNVLISGVVEDVHPGGLTVTFGGSVSAVAVTAADGTFSVTTAASGPGNVTAAVDDGFGGHGTATAAFTNEAPWLCAFTAVAAAGGNNFWTFSGQVNDEAPEGLTITFGGIPALAGVTAIVLADGTFSVTVQLQPNESGIATALVTDWWGGQSELGECYVAAN